MHVAWVFVLVYFSRKLPRPIFIYLILFILLTIVATIYFLQHYLIDIFMGLIIGYLVCYLVERFLQNSPAFARPVEEEIISDIKYIDNRIKSLKLS
jgi:membrane-associated phospholipid phosphatase